MRTTLMAVALLVPGIALADTGYTDANLGLVYALAVQPDGTATLTYLASPTEVFTLRPDCFATHPIYGIGFWKSTGTDWEVKIQGNSFVTFKDQPLPFEGVDCSKGLGDG